MASSPSTETLARPGGRIAFDIHGTGPLVVCVPGMGELRSSYRYNIAALTDAGYSVASMDLRGHGDSDSTFEEYDDVAAGGDILALVEHLGGPAVLVGNSMGAGAAAWAAAERPDLVASLVLIGPFVRNPPTSPFKALAFRLAMSWPWAPAMWHAFLPSLYPLRKPADFEEHRAQIRASMRRPGHARAFAATTRTTHAPVEQRLAEIAAPTLVVMGSADPDFPDPTSEAGWIVDHVADARAMMVEGAGHYPQTEAPELVNPALIDFAERALRRA